MGLITGYLAGSIPFAWFLVKLFKGVDIRQYGTRTVSATMVGVLVSKPAAVLVGILDILKALVPVWIFYRTYSSFFVAHLCGVGALLGHCWPIWLGFHGGRGVSVILGTLTILFPPGTIYLLSTLGIGRIFKIGGTAVLFALLTIPLLAVVLRQPLSTVLFCLIILFVTVVKRIEANREPLPETGKDAVLLRRIFLDRDIKNYKTWITRRL